MTEPILLSRSLYSVEAVNATVGAYSGLATFEVRLGGDDIAVAISDAAPSLSRVLADEFCNHALHETIRRSRGGR